MSGEPLRILQVSTGDAGGGAEAMARALYEGLAERGCESYLAVGVRTSSEAHVLAIPNEARRPAWTRFWTGVHDGLRGPWRGVPGLWRLTPLAAALVAPVQRYRHAHGIEDFGHPGTRDLLRLPGRPPDLVHCHNLHGGYFDLRRLAWLSRRVPVVVSLHDHWLLTGHCSYSLDCSRWQTGCGACPHLDYYPAVARDATAGNWRRKAAIYRRSRLYVTSIAQYVIADVRRSMLAPGVVQAKVVPCGIDTDTFRPGDQAQARAQLGLEPDADILVFAAQGVKRIFHKDYATMRAAVERLGQRRTGRKLVFLALGEAAAPEQVGCAEVRFVPFVRERAVLARYYQAADVYLHAARGELWGLTITEAMACGTPVVASAVGGIPEQVRDGATGFLAPVGDAEAMARRVGQLLDDPALRRRLGAAATAWARGQFPLARYVQTHLDWYREILSRWPAPPPEAQRWPADPPGAAMPTE